MAPSERAATVLIACAVGAATLGLVANLARPAPVTREYAVTGVRPIGTIRRAPTQAELGSTRAGDNRARHALAFRAMQSDTPDRLAAVPFNAEARAAAIADRATRRAYDGAPPTIPHAVSQMSPPNCMTCHAEGLALRGHVASTMPHPYLSSCTQCHVVMGQAMPGAALPGDLSEGNTFVGNAAPGPGARAWPGAPPTIPHTTRMRERCDGCHSARSLGLRASHPWRESCTQCHAPSAALDLRPGLTAP